MKFSREIQTLLADYTGQPLPFKVLLKRTEEHGFGMMITLLTLPFLIPVPLVGISTLLNIGSFLLGVQLGLGFHRPWLPERIVRIQLSPALSTGLLKNFNRLLHPLERLVRPRLEVLTLSGLSRRSIGICIAWCSALTALPLPIPFTNKVPALAMLFLAVGMIEFDGIFILIGYAMVVATTLLYAVLGTIIWEMMESWGKLLH